jgi:hypothetical protein
MKRRLYAMLVLAVLSCLPFGAATAAPGEEKITFAQAERRSIDLKQGMTLDEVQRLLGKPKRTALKTSGYSGTAEAQGTLQWTYTWSSASQSERNLRVSFTGKSPEQWLVSGWDWSGY